jgi:hypothetical protein
LSIANKLQSAAGYGDVAGGALRFEGMTPGQTVNNCYLTGGVGLVMANVTFGGSVNNCGGSGPGGIPNAVGIYAGQISISNVRFLGWKYAFAANSTTTMTAISTESSDTGVVVGLVLPNVFRGFIDDGSGNGTYTGKPGSVLTVTKYAYGPFDSDDGSGAGGHGSGIHSSLSISHSVCLACAPGSTITSQLSTSQVGRFNGAEGRYQLDRPSNPAVPVQTMATDYRGSQPNGVSITGWQTERLNTGLAVWGAFGLAVQNANITGTIGLGIGATRASWSPANGGTITYNLLYDSGRYGAKTCFAESFTPRYNFDQTSSPAFPGGLSCQWQGNAVQIRGVDNPGAPLNGNIPNPGPNLVNGIISPNQDACLSIGHVNASTFRNINCATASLYEIDLSGYNPEGRGRIGFYEMTVSPGLVAPIALPTCACRASIVVQNSYGFGEASLQARYQDLPGVPGAQPNSVYEGEEHLILDAGTCSDGNACNTWGATVTGGGGSKHVKVRWNGTNWTIVGK